MGVFHLGKPQTPYIQNASFGVNLEKKSVQSVRHSFSLFILSNSWLRAEHKSPHEKVTR